MATYRNPFFAASFRMLIPLCIPIPLAGYLEPNWFLINSRFQSVFSLDFFLWLDFIHVHKSPLLHVPVDLAVICCLFVSFSVNAEAIDFRE